MTNPELHDALQRLTARVWELTVRVEDLATIVAVHVQPDPVDVQPPPVDVARAAYYGVCDHGAVLYDGCAACGTTR